MAYQGPSEPRHAHTRMQSDVVRLAGLKTQAEGKWTGLYNHQINSSAREEANS
jgi:hypothetical protein